MLTTAWHPAQLCGALQAGLHRVLTKGSDCVATGYHFNDSLTQKYSSGISTCRGKSLASNEPADIAAGEVIECAEPSLRVGVQEGTPQPSLLMGKGPTVAAILRFHHDVYSAWMRGCKFL